MMRLNADWLNHPGTVAVFDALVPQGAWFVGGCVRDGLLARPVDDIDICTEALPDAIVDLAQSAGLKAIPTGIDHGTITVVAGGKPHEITTLRRDLETDGRYARVAFTAELGHDAARRDFTINALYATRDGEVLDPNGTGMADLDARRVRFIGDADARIAEDYLRILRFFRFHAWYADPEGGIDADGLAACAAGIDGLTQLSKERVGAEIRKLLSAPDPAPAIATMEQSGILAAILPGASSDILTVLTGLDGTLPPDPIRRLAAIGGEEPARHLRLSKAKATRLALYRSEMARLTSPSALGYHHGLDAAVDILTLRGAITGQPPTSADMHSAKIGSKATFPIKAADLPHLHGPALGAELKALETRWIASTFQLSKSDLLA